MTAKEKERQRVNETRMQNFNKRQQALKDDIFSKCPITGFQNEPVPIPFKSAVNSPRLLISTKHRK